MAVTEIRVESASGNEHVVEAEFDYTIENDGVGAYEYWGFRGVDSGTDYLGEITVNSLRLIRKHRRFIDIAKLSPVFLEAVEEEIRSGFDWRTDIAESFL